MLPFQDIGQLAIGNGEEKGWINERVPPLDRGVSNHEQVVEMIYVVLGMHKSGTTLVSQILHYSGINMGDFDENISYDGGNKYERQSCLDLDMDILGAEDVRIMKLRSDKRVEIDDTMRARMRQIISDCESAHDDWGFKDPRSLLVYDLWAEELPTHKIVAVYRDPCEVWPRFRWQKGKYYLNFHQAYEYLSIWHDHTLSLIKYLKESSMEHVLLSYHDLMSGDDTFQVLSQFTGRELVDRRRLNLYRSRARMDVFLLAADAAMKIRKGISFKETFAQLEAMKTPVRSDSA